MGKLATGLGTLSTPILSTLLYTAAKQRLSLCSLGFTQHRLAEINRIFSRRIASEFEILGGVDNTSGFEIRILMITNILVFRCRLA